MTNKQRANLLKKVTVEEIKKPIFNIGNDKSLGQMVLGVSSSKLLRISLEKMYALL